MLDGYIDEAPRPTLFIDWDEKKFEGLKARKRAKAAPSKGVKQVPLKAKNTNYIPSVMILAFVGIFCRTGIIADGGDGAKLGFYRAQRARVAKTSRREKRFKETGEGPEWSYRKGDTVLRDCTIRASDSGTSSDPHYDLLSFFLNVFFPFLLSIVGPDATKYGGKYRGWRVIMQGDNASCHTEAKFLQQIQEFCARYGWHFLFQAAHAPHLNVCDLCLFPSLSKGTDRKRADKFGRRCISGDDLAAAAQSAFEAYPSSSVAASFVTKLAVARKVIQERGRTEFLAKTSRHFGTQRKYQKTEHGVRKR